MGSPMQVRADKQIGWPSLSASPGLRDSSSSASYVSLDSADLPLTFAVRCLQPFDNTLVIYDSVHFMRRNLRDFSDQRGGKLIDNRCPIRSDGF